MPVAIIPLFAYALKAFESAIVKFLRSDIPFNQIVFFRFFIGFFFILFLCKKNGGIKKFIPRTDYYELTLKAILGLCYIGLTYWLIPFLPLADFTAISYVNPILLAIMGYLILGESIPRIRWLAIALGMLGVALVSSPSDSSISISALMLAFGAALAAYSDIVIRKIAHRHSPLTISLSYFLFALLVTSATLPFSFVSLSLQNISLLVIVGILSSLFQVLLAKSLQQMHASALAPFDYTTIGWAILFDIVIWGIYPDMKGLFGTVLILLDGFLAYYSFKLISNKTSSIAG